MKSLAAWILACAALAQGQVKQTDTLRVQTPVDEGIHLGEHRFSAQLVNLTDGPLTVVLDLRSDPGLWLRKTQRQFIYLLQGREERRIEET